MLEESVRWLLTNGKKKEAERILRKAARWNKVDYSKVEAVWTDMKPLNVEESIPQNEKTPIPEEELNKENNVISNYSDINTESKTAAQPMTGAVKKYTVIDILKNPKLRVNTLILWYAW